MGYSFQMIEEPPAQLITKRVGDRWVLKVQKSRKVLRRQTPPQYFDWFGPGKPCYVVRSWQERADSGPTLSTKRERTKGRIIGYSRRGRVWVLVYFNKRKDKQRERYWELRLCDANEVSPLSAGVSVPPELPEVWKKQLYSKSFDNTRKIA